MIWPKELVWDVHRPSRGSLGSTVETSDGQDAAGWLAELPEHWCEFTLSSFLLSCPNPSLAPSPAASCKQLPLFSGSNVDLFPWLSVFCSCLCLWFQSSYSITSGFFLWQSLGLSFFGIQPSILASLIYAWPLNEMLPALALGLWNLTIWAPHSPMPPPSVCLLGIGMGKGSSFYFGLKNYDWFPMIREMQIETMNYHSHLPD